MQQNSMLYKIQYDIDKKKLLGGSARWNRLVSDKGNFPLSSWSLMEKKTVNNNRLTLKALAKNSVILLHQVCVVVV